MVKLISSKWFYLMCLFCGSHSFAFDYPKGFGEDHLTHAELQGDEIYGKSNSQTAWSRYRYTPWNSQTTWGPLSSFEGVFSSRLNPVLQVETTRHQGTYFIMGNEVGDPLYQELKSNKNNENRTPTIQWQFQTEHSPSDKDKMTMGQMEIPWKFTIGFEQVDHMSIQSSRMRTKRLGADWRTAEQGDAFSWFGSNFPTSSVLYSQINFGSADWEQSISYQDGYLWWNTGREHQNRDLRFNEFPLNFRQVNWSGQWGDFRWTHQSVSAYMSYTDSIDLGSQAPAASFQAWHLSQHLSRLGVDALIPQSHSSYVGVLSQINNIRYSRRNQNDSIPDSQSPQLFAETQWQSLSWMNINLESEQTFSESLYQGTHGLKWSSLTGHWQQTLRARWNYWTRPSIYLEVSPLNPDRPFFRSQWYDFQYSHSRLLGVQVLKVDHQFFYANEQMKSLKESLEFGINKPGSLRMLARLSYELTWGKAWRRAEVTPPSWRYYHNLEFSLPTGLMIQPIYTWTSSYQSRTSDRTQSVSPRHGLHLRFQQNLFQNRLQAWVEMVHILSADEVLHPVGQEDRFRTILGASFDF